jgi:MarR family transcriptional regulator, transcriptional regulator for hemolysin
MALTRKAAAPAPSTDTDASADTWQLTLGHLIGDLARAMRVAVDQRMKRKGITRAQWMILSRVSYETGIIQKDLAAGLDLTKFAVTEPLRRMEESGWIERRDDPQDGRMKRLYLTKAGGELVRYLRRVQREVTHACAAPLDERRGLELIAALKAMKDHTVQRRQDELAG